MMIFIFLNNIFSLVSISVGFGFLCFNELKPGKDTVLKKSTLCPHNLLFNIENNRKNNHVLLEC